ncbi:MAG TPA: cysteine synthase A [Clostridia bacterium]|nr:cysteine synthase A [Clostridia bacterium]
MSKDIIELIGNTPVINLSIDGEEIYLKLESRNMTGSIKMRTAYGMIKDAEDKGLLNEKSIIIEPTSGNTGIALSMLGRLKGYKVIIVMPETMSNERKNEIKSYGAELILTPGNEGMKGSINKVESMLKANDNYVYLDQFRNPANPGIHYEMTSVEIINQVPDIDYFIEGVGTGGSITGISRRLKEETNAKVVAIEPEESSVLSGNDPGPHKIQGIGAGFIPEILDTKMIDDIIKVNSNEAFEMTRKIRDIYGLLFGLSTGANVAGAIKLAKKVPNNSKIVTINCDIGERYLSTGVFNEG